MKRIIAIISAALLSIGFCFAQQISDRGYKTIGYIKSDGTVQDASYRTLGYVRDVPMRWAALFFFFKL